MSEKNSGGQKGDIQRHTFRRTERQTYIYSQRNIQQTEGRHTETHSDGQKGRHTYTVRETFRRKEGRHTETHIQTDRRTDIHIQSKKHSADRRETYRDKHSDGQKDIRAYTVRETFRRTEIETYRDTYLYLEGQKDRHTHRVRENASGQKKRHTETHI